jgi:hypothetical protein
MNNETLIQWLVDHPLINRKALCDAVGYDVSNLHNAINGSRPIPQRVIDLMSEVLSNYGLSYLPTQARQPDQIRIHPQIP